MDIDWLEQVQQLWENYISKAEQLERDRKPGAGFLGLIPGPKNDPCHQQFFEDAEKLLADMRAASPSSATARQVLSYIFQVSLKHPKPLTVYWELQAAHALVLPLIPLLEPEDAASLQTEYVKSYLPRERLPAQKKVLSALEKASART